MAAAAVLLIPEFRLIAQADVDIFRALRQSFVQLSEDVRN